MRTPQELSKIQQTDIPDPDAREISRIHKMVHSTNKVCGIGSSPNNQLKHVDHHANKNQAGHEAARNVFTTNNFKLTGQWLSSMNSHLSSNDLGRNR
ncbi:hypothetical protein MJO28_007671 [Puccinia striiformis f. sp. tritici]|uniref:Uncharacterized protein n=1 Tax=Puccinia striiformis f. sp. tritici TaxID=168172 RepID=A0ACC0EI13_9BASI|nr:hypothetical protein MJO28_007671 [Puccinia striiformis f. sp. tritici]KAI7956213.1 hypothetical protein MJO29_007612 [Puccinia striiformis f. sp. tritici]